MPTQAEHRPRDVLVWAWLVGLHVIGLAVIGLPIPEPVLLFSIFGVAAVCAALVVRDYMHLKSENLLFYVIAGVPILFVIGLLLVLVPDIITRH